MSETELQSQLTQLPQEITPEQSMDSPAVSESEESKALSTTDSDGTKEELEEEAEEGDENRCLECAKTFPSKAGLIFHLRTHKTKAHRCSVCKKGFPTSRRLEEHKCGWGSGAKAREEAKEAKAKAPLSCPQCLKVFVYAGRLASHVCAGKGGGGEAAKESGKGFRCPKCRKAFAYRTNLLKHACHPPREPLPVNAACERCGKTFVRPGNAARHICAALNADEVLAKKAGAVV